MEEAKTEGQLAFLGVLISQKPDGSIDMTVYRNQSVAHKIAVVRTLYPNTIRRNYCKMYLLFQVGVNYCYWH